MLRECYWIADGILQDALTGNPVGGALHYHSTTMAHPPSWAAQGNLVGTIGHHRFCERVPV